VRIYVIVPEEENYIYYVFHAICLCLYMRVCDVREISLEQLVRAFLDETKNQITFEPQNLIM
jgi:hypothetical protein